MAIKYTRPTNSKPCVYTHTITSTDVSDGYVTLDFKVDMPLTAIIQSTNDDGVIQDITTAKVTYPANGKVKIEPSTGSIAEVRTVLCVADVSSSLNNKYFTISSTTVNYYVWFNVGAAGVDPAPGGTGVVVAISANATAATVATAVKSALDGISGGAVFTTTRNTATLTITNGVAGKVTDAAANNTGFTVTMTTQGVTASAEGNFALEAGNKISVVAFRNSSSVGAYLS